MATSKQEKTYNEIIEYYNYADKLIKIAEDDEGPFAQKQFAIIEEAVEKIEECADKLTCEYIEYVKGGDPKHMFETVKHSLTEIMRKIEECRNRILKLYEKHGEAA